MSCKPIQDEFTNRPISRQRKYQLRMARAGRCTKCGQLAVSNSLCLNCLLSLRERTRREREVQRTALGQTSGQGRACQHRQARQSP